jgi:hypothetical protein
MSQSESDQKLEWSVFPFTENLKRSIIVIVIIIACGIVVYLAFRDVFLGVLSVLILLASLHSYFSRTRYYLDQEGVIIRTSLAKTAKKWSDFKRFYADKKGITLSPFAKPSRLEPFRSVRLLFGGNREDVVAFISEVFGGDEPADS